MRFPDQTLIGDLNDDFSAKTSGSININLPTSSINENETVYDLLPAIINRPPEIILPIADASTPQIQAYAIADASGDFMYLHPDGNVKLNLGTNIKLSIKAQQPPVLNVENGVPKMIEPSTGLFYVWRRDGQMLTSTANASLRSNVIVNGDTVTFNNIQPENAGTYTCEISNDIGTVVSEPVTLEVYNLDFDAFFYRNLVTNPYGADGTNGWEVNNTDLTTKTFTTQTSAELIRPSNITNFGYSTDTMHPRPYQIDMGVIRGFDMTKHFTSQQASYFTRTRYKFDRRGGTFLVRAYQDIDLTDIIPLIRGGIYGVAGVRALFSCYIGNGVSQFIPVLDTLQVKDKFNLINYILSEPRISVENFLWNGPATGVADSVYVTLEEYNNETRLPSLIFANNTASVQNDRIILNDPWNKRMSKYWGQIYYDEDIYGLGELSKGDGRDAILFTADELYPDPQYRFAYGQYAEFNKVILERLNPKTTKIRISINFETKDVRVFDQWEEAYQASEDILDIVSWEQPYIRNQWNTQPGTYETSIVKRLRDAVGTDKPLIEIISTAQDPRGMVTGLNLTLLPILTQQPDIIKYYTDSTLAINTTPTSSMISGLGGGRGYDPFGLLTPELQTTFKYYSDENFRINNQGLLTMEDRIEIKLDLVQPSTVDPSRTPQRFPVDSVNYLPFADNTSTIYEIAPIQYARGTGDEQALFNDYVRLSSIPTYAPASSSELPGIVNSLQPLGWNLSPMSSSRRPNISNPSLEQYGVWSKKARYTLYFVASGSAIIFDTNPNAAPVSSVNANKTSLLSSTLGPISPTIDLVPLQTYNLEVDFSVSGSSRVTLSRTADLLPGKGDTSGSIELEHYVDAAGQLACIIPPSFITTGTLRSETSAGGFGYRSVGDVAIAAPTSNTSASAISLSPINAITFLRDNLGRYIGSTYTSSSIYQQKVLNVLNVADVILDSTNLIGVSSSLIESYKQDIETYALVSGSSINRRLYNEIDTTITTPVVLDQLFIQAGNPEIKNLRLPGIGRPSLIAVRSADPTTGTGTPVAGMDNVNRPYNISFASIQDSVRGTYANAISNATGSGAISPGLVITQSLSGSNIENISR